jgi:hypothetical protein
MVIIIIVTIETHILTDIEVQIHLLHQRLIEEKHSLKFTNHLTMEVAESVILPMKKQ